MLLLLSPIRDCYNLAMGNNNLMILRGRRGGVTGCPFCFYGDDECFFI